MKANRRRMARWLVGVSAIVVTLFVSHPAAASIYVWRVDADGEWTNPANWRHVTGTGPVGAGYPNGVGDQAAFTGLYSADRAIVVGNTTLTVGQITISTTRRISVVAGAGGNLVFDNGYGARVDILDLSGVGGGDLLDIPLNLRGPLHVTVGQGLLRVAGIHELEMPRSVTKLGAGSADLFRSNTYTGATVVEDGVLALTGSALSSELVVGTGGSRSPILVSGEPNLIADTARVTVNANGTMQFLQPERVGDVVVNGGGVGAFLSEPGVVAVRSLTMTGGQFQFQVGSQLLVESDLLATSDAAGPARISPVVPGGTPGTWNVTGPSQRVAVADGPAELDLEIEIPVTGAGGLIKDGPGTLRMSGPGSNTYAGPTLVRGGRLELAKDGDALAIPGSLQVGESPAAASVTLFAGTTNVNGFADTASISVGSGGRLELSSDERFDRLSVAAGGEW